MKHRMILSLLRYFCLILKISTIGIYATPLPYPGQNIWHVAAEIGTDVDLLLSKLDECCATLISTVTTNCDPIPLYQTNVSNGGILLTTTGASYCLSQNITGSIIISASDVTVDLNMHSLIGTIDIIGTSSNVTIKNGNVKPAAPISEVDAAHAAIAIGADAYNTLIKNVYVINADSIGFVGRDGINNAGTNTIIDSNIVQAGSGTPTGGSGIINTGLNVYILKNKIIGGIGNITSIAYVTNLGNDTVSVVDTATNTIVATITVGTSPFNVAITPDGSKAYVVNAGNNTVSVIDTATNTVINTITVGVAPVSVAIMPNGTKAYVVNNSSNTVSVIDIATDTVIATITVGNFPNNIAITPDGTNAYVTNQTDSTASVIDTTTDTVITTITVGPSPQDIAITPDGNKGYVTNFGANTVTVLDIATNTVITTITVGLIPFGVSITPDGSKAYVVNAVSNNVSVIDVATDTVITTITVGASPRFIAITPDGTKGYVTNNGASTVSVINIATNTVIATITGFSLPIGIDITAAAGLGGNGIVQEGSQGKIIENIITGGAGSISNSGGAGILVSAATNCNIIQECLAQNGAGDGFTILTTGTVNLIDCIASCNAVDGFDLSQSTGRGIVKRCEALQNIGCGFKDRSDSLYQYVSNSSEGNDGSPAVPAGDTNYCWSDFSNTSTFTPPSGPGSRPFYQWARNGDDGTFFGVSNWDNVTLP